MIIEIDKVNEDECCTARYGTSRMGSQSSARSAGTHDVLVVVCGKLGRCDRASHSIGKRMVGHLVDAGLDLSIRHSCGHGSNDRHVASRLRR